MFQVLTGFLKNVFRKLQAEAVLVALRCQYASNDVKHLKPPFFNIRIKGFRGLLPMLFVTLRDGQFDNHAHFMQ